MGRSSKARKVDNRGPLQRAYDAEKVDEEQSHLDVLTPEQRLKDIYAAEREDGKGRRYFRLQQLDRLHRNGKLTYEQHQAGKWYRDEWDRARFDAPQISTYGERITSNVITMTSADYRQDARDRWRSARMEWPRDMIGFMDAFLLRDRFPRLHHRAAARQLSDVRRALDAMARHLRLT